MKTGTTSRVQRVCRKICCRAVSWLESKINEWTEAIGVESTKAEHKSGEAKHQSHCMPRFVVIGEINLVLHFEAELGKCKEREESGYEHGDVKLWVVAEMECRKIEGKQSFDKQPRQVNTLDAEETTGEHDDEKSEKHTRNPAQTFVELLEKQLVGTNEDALQGTIYHKVPSSTVPQSAQKET